MKFVTALWVLCSLVPCLSAQEEKRPNILFIFADDWGRVASAYAALDGPGTFNGVVKTPNIDRVSREGVIFRHASVSAPSCTPCRSALLSGQHFWRTGRGSILRGAVWDGANPSFGLILRDAGYHLGKSYKVWGPGKPEIDPFGGGKHAYEKAGRKFNQFSQTVTKQMAEGTPREQAKQSLYQEVQDNFEAFLKKRQQGQPFVFWCGPTNTHRSWIKGSGKTLWDIDPDSLKGKLPGFLPDVPEVREDFADYLGEVQALDTAIGVLLNMLEAVGELENTLVVLSGDHGPPGFPHGKCNLYDFGSSVSLIIRGPGVKPGRVIDDLVSLTDLAPTFLETGKAPVPEVMTGRSLWPLLSSEKSGQIDPSRDAVFIGRERHVENARDAFLPYPQRAIRTATHLYIVNFKPDRWPLGEPYRLDGATPPSVAELTENTRSSIPDEDAGPTKAWLVGLRHDAQWAPCFERAYGKRPREEMYDLTKDRDQIRNLAVEAVYEEVRAGLKKRLMDELKHTGDPRLIDDGRFFETPPMAGPTEDGSGQSPEDLRRPPVSPRN